MKKEEKILRELLDEKTNYSNDYCAIKQEVLKNLKQNEKQASPFFNGIMFVISAVLVFVFAVSLSFFTIQKIESNKATMLDGQISTINTAKSIYLDSVDLCFAYKSPTRNLTLEEIMGSSLLSEKDKDYIFKQYKNKKCSLSLALAIDGNEEKVFIDDMLQCETNSFKSNLNYSYYDVIAKFEEQIGAKLSTEFLNNEYCGITIDFIEDEYKYVELYKLVFNGKIHVVQM